MVELNASDILFTRVSQCELPENNQKSLQCLAGINLSFLKNDNLMHMSFLKNDNLKRCLQCLAGIT
jgi:hypothetical protein